MGIADQRDTLALLGEPASLFDREEGLATSRSSADLDAGKQTRRIEYRGLLLGEQVAGVFVLECARDHVALRQSTPRQHICEFEDRIRVDPGSRDVLIDEHLHELADDPAQIVTVDHLPAGTFRQGEVCGKGTVGEHDHVIPPHVADGTAGIVVDVPA